MSGLADAVRDWQPGIPCPWPSLSSRVVVRPGGLTIVAGAPGALKSMLMLNWLLAVQEPTLYLSLDTSRPMQAGRVIAHETGRPVGSVYLDLDDEELRETWVPWLEDFDARTRMRMLDVPCTAAEVGQIVSAFSDYWGQTPTMTVVDDLSKLKATRDYQTYDESVTELGRIAKRMNTVVVAIQHTNRGGGLASQRPKLRDLKYTGEYEPAYILGLWRQGPDKLRVSVLKNRTGEDDQHGALYAQLHADAPHMTIREETYLEQFGGVVGGTDDRGGAAVPGDKGTDAGDG